ncbi:MAG: hypothetical protein UW28_C0010G0006 [Parcubacteria group bacterium GW2011_GWA2_44_13]|nr:MAG: hypothetical protein UW28_C0010G0006 [Parcubacteria group bacterium GW2011_GWA2_44_13]
MDSMKLSVVSAFILISFAGIALFGFIVMEHEGHGHIGCIAATSQGGGCPQSKEFDFTIFHLEAYKSFSSSILAGSFSPLLFLLALFLIAALFICPAGILLQNSIFFAGTIYSPPVYFHKEEFTRWLSLHEQSPNFSV